MRQLGLSDTSATPPGAQVSCLQASAEMTDQGQYGMIMGGLGNKGRGHISSWYVQNLGDSPPREGLPRDLLLRFRLPAEALRGAGCS